MDSGGPARPRSAKIKVRFDQQQRQLLEFLRAEGTFGRDDGEIICNVVLDYIRQQEQQHKQPRPRKRT